MAAAPRFLFWSTLFWTGLFLIAIQRADSKPWLRSPVYLAALALPVLMFPQHYKTGVARRWGMSLAESAAMSLVNETKGEQMTKVLFRDPSQIYHVAPQLRARRLDMFTDGLQDWIGLSETNLFGGRHKPERLTGDCSVTALVQGDDGLEAARVIGQASTKENSIPERLVIVDPTGVVRGVARSSTMSSILIACFIWTNLANLAAIHVPPAMDSWATSAITIRNSSTRSAAQMTRLFQRKRSLCGFQSPKPQSCK